MEFLLAESVPEKVDSDSSDSNVLGCVNSLDWNFGKFDDIITWFMIGRKIWIVGVNIMPKEPLAITECNSPKLLSNFW